VEAAGHYPVNDRGQVAFATEKRAATEGCSGDGTHTDCGDRLRQRPKWKLASFAAHPVPALSRAAVAFRLDRWRRRAKACFCQTISGCALSRNPGAGGRIQVVRSAIQEPALIGNVVFLAGVRRGQNR
jgi:hypothetical protein